MLGLKSRRKLRMVKGQVSALLEVAEREKAHYAACENWPVSAHHGGMARMARIVLNILEGK